MPNLTAKLAATSICALAISATAGAQSLDRVPGPDLHRGMAMSPISAPAFTLSRGADRETWHTIMIVGAVLLFAGLLDGDSTLTAIGGAGVLLALVETNGNSFAWSPVGRSLNFYKNGALSFGINPLSRLGYTAPGQIGHPGLVLQARFKF